MVLCLWSTFGQESSGVPAAASGRDGRGRREGERTGARQVRATDRERQFVVRAGGGRDAAFVRNPYSK